MKRILFTTLLALLALGMSSCRRMAEKAAQKIRIEGVESVTPKGLSSAEAVLRITNGTSHKLLLRDVKFELFYQTNHVLTIKLQEEVEVAKRSSGPVATRWRIRINDPLALLLIGRDLAQENTSNLYIRYTVEGRGGPVAVNQTSEQMPLSDFLRIFGVSLDDIKPHIH